MFERPTAFTRFQPAARRASFFATPNRYAIPTTPLAAIPQHASFLMADADLTSSTTFEPVLNVPAFGAFFLIMAMALLLRLRVGAISDAADQRIAALEELRDAKSKELNNEATPDQVALAISAYETALQKEEGLRTLLPGIRLRAPNNPVNSERDQQAARQFLKDDTILPPPVDESKRSSLGPVAVGALLTFLFGSQILLFAFLSMDDNTATNVLNSIAETSDPAAAELLEPSFPDGTVAETIGDLVGME